MLAIDWMQAFAAVATVIDVCLLLGMLALVVGAVLVIFIETIDP